MDSIETIERMAEDYSLERADEHLRNTSDDPDLVDTERTDHGYLDVILDTIQAIQSDADKILQGYEPQVLARIIKMHCSVINNVALRLYSEDDTDE